MTWFSATIGDDGDDWLTGGAGADTFVFADGNDVIRNFTDDQDAIILAAAGLPPGFGVADLRATGCVADGNAVFSGMKGSSLP